MAYGAFIDRANRPDEAEVEVSLAEAVFLWTELATFVEGSFSVRSDWKFYGKNYGWSLAYKKSGKASSRSTRAPARLRRR